MGDTGNETRSAFFSNTELVGKTCKVGGGGGDCPIAKSFRHRSVPKLVGVFSSLFL